MRLIDTFGKPVMAVAAAFVLANTSQAQCNNPVPDVYEPNDDCLTAPALVNGTYTGLSVEGTGGTYNDDFFAVTVPVGEILTVDCLFIDATADVDLYLYDPATSPNCGGEAFGDYLVRGFSVTDNEQVSWANGGAVPLSLIVRVEMFSAATCNDYDLVISTAPDPCQAAVDDAFEENDSCAAAVALAAGAHAGLFVSETDGDFYTVSVPAGNILTVDVTYASGVNGDPDLYLYDDLACTNEVDSVFPTAGSGQVIWNNGTGATATVVLEARILAGEGCNNYDLNVAVAPDPCQVAADDTFEPNDNCAAAVTLPSGATTGLFVSETDGDFYSISVPVGEILTVDVTYASGINADPDLYLFDDPACANQVDVNFSFGGAGQVEWSNATGAVATVMLEVRVIAGEGCNNYDLNVSTAPDPCLDPLSDDILEDNDDCLNALPMSDGTYPGLFVSKADHDFYEVSVADMDTLFVDLLFSTATADVDVYIYDDQVACGDLASYLVRGFSGTDNENISWTNTTGSVQTYYVQVVVWASSSGECNNYDMTLTGSGGVLAAPFCYGDGSADVGGGLVGCPCANESTLGAGEGCTSSLGFGAKLEASGTSIVANDDLVFTISQARPSQPSMLIQGSTLVAFPFKDGILCMGTPTERVEVVFLDGAGGGSTVGSIVTNGNVSPGDTRYYQQWYRDPGGVSPCGNGSNFTQGLTLTWM